MSFNPGLMCTRDQTELIRRQVHIRPVLFLAPLGVERLSAHATVKSVMTREEKYRLKRLCAVCEWLKVNEHTGKRREVRQARKLCALLSRRCQEDLKNSLSFSAIRR